MAMHFQTVAAMACMKSLLMVFNFIFWLSGIVILVIGIWMEVDLYKYMEMSTEYSNTAPYLLIGTGALIFLIGSFACCCTLKGQPVLLYIYSGILAIIFVLELSGGVSIYAYRTKLMQGFDDGLSKAMKNYHNESAHITADFDAMQQTLQCCGNHRPTDWLNIIPPEIPKSCCIKENCDTEDDSQIFKEGCYDKVVNFLNSNIGTVAIAATSVAFFPLIGMILSSCLACLLNKHKYEQMA